MLQLENIQVNNTYTLNFKNIDIAVLFENLTKEKDKYIYHFQIINPKNSKKELIILDSLTYGSLWYLMS